LTRIGSPRSYALEAILPASVSVVAARGDIADATLFPEEEAAVSRAVEGRRHEFATARACARAALEPWALSRQAIPVGSKGEPRWPAGIVGSITHCEGYCACAVARRADLLTIGIDAEPNQPLPEGILAEVAFGDEPALVRRLAAAAPDVRWDRLVFSAKEAIYKAWFPLARTWLGFGDAALAIDPGAGTFSARLLVRGPRRPEGVPQNLDGRWTIDEGLILTAVAVAQ
jgi:enterobactin synthetase component D / holo-[acyl-carrier protein] synthase